MVSKNYMHNNISVGKSRNIDNAEELRIINYPGILQNMYCISRFGKIYSIANDSYISWSVRGNLPYVNLSCNKDGIYVLEPFYIKDLVACSYLDNSIDYLERGYHAVNIDGDPMNCNYHNIVYIK